MNAKKFRCKLKGHKIDIDLIDCCSVYRCRQCGEEEISDEDYSFRTFGLLPKIQHLYFDLWCRWQPVKDWFTHKIVWKYFHSDKDLPF